MRREEFLNPTRDAGTRNTSAANAMLFFHRANLTVHCAYRGLALSVPDRDRLLNACEPGKRHRLQRHLGEQSPYEPAWTVQWRKNPGDRVQPAEVVATLHRDGIIVELAYAQKGVIAERLIEPGERVAVGRRLAMLERRAKVERRAKGSAAPEPTTKALFRHFVARQRRDAEVIASLQIELAALQARLVSGSAPGNELKFKRLKHEFSKHFHPDARPPGDAERERRARVFQEFWPIFEEIERS
jgi:hypothetical protein